LYCSTLHVTRRETSEPKKTTSKVHNVFDCCYFVSFVSFLFIRRLVHFDVSNQITPQKPLEYRQLDEKPLLGTAGKKGNAAGQFEYPHAIVYDPQHEEMIVSDSSNHRLQWFHRPTLKHLHSFGKRGAQLGDFSGPSGLCLQPHTRHLVVSDSFNHRVQIFSNPHYSPSPSPSSSSPPIPLYAIGRASSKGSNEKGQFNIPQGVCCAANGDITVADTNDHRVQLFDASGRFIPTFGKQGRGDQELDYPTDLCYLHPPFSFSSSSCPSSSMLCVADYLNKRVSMWSGDGQQHLFDVQVSGFARGLCVDLHGYLHVSSGDPFHVLRIFDPRQSFRLIQTLGKFGGHEGTRVGEFNHPTGMCVDDRNTLMVCDYSNHRVQFFPQL
jgi:hypothetical protein